MRLPKSTKCKANSHAHFQTRITHEMRICVRDILYMLLGSHASHRDSNEKVINSFFSSLLRFVREWVAFFDQFNDDFKRTITKLGSRSALMRTRNSRAITSITAVILCVLQCLWREGGDIATGFCRSRHAPRFASEAERGCVRCVGEASIFVHTAGERRKVEALQRWRRVYECRTKLTTTTTRLLCSQNALIRVHNAAAVVQYARPLKR